MYSNSTIELGFVPSSLLHDLRDLTNWKVRANAIEKLNRHVADLTNLDPVVPHLPQLFVFLTGLLEDNNFTIINTSFEIIGSLIEKFGGSSIRSSLENLVPSLVEKLGDNKAMTRRAGVRVLHKLMRVTGAVPVVGMLLPYLSHTSSHVRMEAVNVLITALVLFQGAAFDMDALVGALVSVLADPSQKVRGVAIEALAVAHAVAGPRALGPHLQALDEPTRATLQHRFSMRVLPQVNPDGTVEHVLHTTAAPVSSPAPSTAQQGALQAVPPSPLRNDNPPSRRPRRQSLAVPLRPALGAPGAELGRHSTIGTFPDRSLSNPRPSAAPTLPVVGEEITSARPDLAPAHSSHSHAHTHPHTHARHTHSHGRESPGPSEHERAHRTGSARRRNPSAGARHARLPWEVPLPRSASDGAPRLAGPSPSPLPSASPSVTSSAASSAASSPVTSGAPTPRQPEGDSPHPPSPPLSLGQPTTPPPPPPPPGARERERERERDSSSSGEETEEAPPVSALSTKPPLLKASTTLLKSPGRLFVEMASPTMQLPPRAVSLPPGDPHMHSYYALYRRKQRKQHRSLAPLVPDPIEEQPHAETPWSIAEDDRAPSVTPPYGETGAYRQATESAPPHTHTHTHTHTHAAPDRTPLLPPPPETPDLERASPAPLVAAGHRAADIWSVGAPLDAEARTGQQPEDTSPVPARPPILRPIPMHRPAPASAPARADEPATGPTDTPPTSPAEAGGGGPFGTDTMSSGTTGSALSESLRSHASVSSISSVSSALSPSPALSAAARLRRRRHARSQQTLQPQPQPQAQPQLAAFAPAPTKAVPERNAVPEAKALPMGLLGAEAWAARDPIPEAASPGETPREQTPLGGGTRAGSARGEDAGGPETPPHAPPVVPAPSPTLSAPTVVEASPAPTHRRLSAIRRARIARRKAHSAQVQAQSGGHFSSLVVSANPRATVASDQSPVRAPSFSSASYNAFAPAPQLRASLTLPSVPAPAAPPLLSNTLPSPSRRRPVSPLGVLPSPRGHLENALESLGDEAPAHHFPGLVPRLHRGNLRRASSKRDLHEELLSPTGAHAAQQLAIGRRRQDTPPTRTPERPSAVPNESSPVRPGGGEEEEEITLTRAPDAELQYALESASPAQDWMVQSRALATLRVLVARHPTTVKARIHDALQPVLALSANLRSSLSRNALHTLAIFYRHLGRALEPELDATMRLLVRKMGDSSKFIEAETDLALTEITGAVSLPKLWPRLVSYATHKSPAVRSKMYRFIALSLRPVEPTSVQHTPTRHTASSLAALVTQHRDLGTLLTAVARGIGDSHPDARSHARAAAAQLGQLIPAAQLQTLLDRHLDSKQLQNAFQQAARAASGAHAGPMGSPSKLPVPTGRARELSAHRIRSKSARRTRLGVQPPPTAEMPPTPAAPSAPAPETALTASSTETPASLQPRRGDAPRQGSAGPPSSTPVLANARMVDSLLFPPELHALPALFAGFTSPDWKIRFDCVSAALSSLKRYPALMAQPLSQDAAACSPASLFCQFLLPTLTDSVPKVARLALNGLADSVPRLKDALDAEAFLVPIVRSVAGAIGRAKGGGRALPSLTETAFNPHAAETTVLDAARRALVSIASHVECTAAMHAIISALTDCPPRAKTPLLQVLLLLTPSICSLRRRHVARHIVPAAARCTEDPRPDVRQAASALLAEAQRLTGEAPHTASFPAQTVGPGGFDGALAGTAVQRRGRMT